MHARSKRPSPLSRTRRRAMPQSRTRCGYTAWQRWSSMTHASPPGSCTEARCAQGYALLDLCPPPFMRLLALPTCVNRVWSHHRMCCEV